MSLLKTISEGDLCVVPIIALDFSLNNMSGRYGNMHIKDPTKRNDYLDTVKMICRSFENITSLPMFGFGAKTSQLKQDTSLFPLSKNLRNTFVSNEPSSVTQLYLDCL
jgi:hypothetical protein